MSDIRELLATAEAIGFKINHQKLEVERINAEIADLTGKLNEAQAEAAKFTTELESAYDQCVAAGLPRDKVVTVVEGMVALLIDAGAAPEAGSKPQVRKTRRSKKNADGTADADSASASEGSAEPVVANTAVATPTEQVTTASATPVASNSQEPARQTVAEHAAIAPNPAPQAAATIVAPPAASAAQTAPEAPEAAVEAPPLANDHFPEDDAPALGDDEDETFGVDVELFSSEDEPDGGFDEEDFDTDALANGTPSLAPVSSQERSIPATGPDVSAAAQPAPNGGFRRPSFLNNQK